MCSSKSDDIKANRGFQQGNNKIDGMAGTPPKKRRLLDFSTNLEGGPSCSKVSGNVSSPKRKNGQWDSDSSDDDNVPLKRLCGNGVNVGASTSKRVPDDDYVYSEDRVYPRGQGCSKDLENKKDPELAEDQGGESKDQKGEGPDSGKDKLKCEERGHPKDCRCKERKTCEFVRFRQNMAPIIVRRDPAVVERELAQREREQRDGSEQRQREVEREREFRPRAHVLYVNVGQQLHTVYRLSIHNEPPIFYSFAGNSHLRFRPNVGNALFTAPTPHLDSTSLVSDAAVRRFGRADVDDVNYIDIGPRQGNEPGARPNRSSLRVLSVTGFRNITDRSLVHLATAAPNLRVLDLSETRVTSQGVEDFKSLRPECEVKYSSYVAQEE